MIRRIAPVLLTLSLAALASAPRLHAQASQNASSSSAMPRDARIETVSYDLRALSRIANLAKDLSDSRQVMLAILDADIESLRMPREDGTYRWASLQREEASRVSDQKDIERVSTEKELREVTVTAPKAYRLVVSVPSKRNLISANNRVYIRNAVVDSTGFDGKTTHHEIPVNAWVNPGDSNGIALSEIGKSVKAMVELGVESGNKKAVAEVALLQAKLVDDPTSPYFPAAKRLLQIRETAAAKDIDRGRLKNGVDEALLALPGELDRRATEMAAAEEQRKQTAARGSIGPGDATPDVIDTVAEALRLLGGTLDDQAQGRARLTELINKLRPPANPAPQP
jgi:hypothetical protein